MKTTDAEIAALIEAVRQTSKTEILPRFRNLNSGEIDRKSGPEDLVTVADRAAEAALTEASISIMPDAVVVGEEAVSENRSILGQVGSSGRCVVIDPIDGTANYTYGLSVFGVIIAVVEEGQTTVGILYDPVLDDWVMAKKGAGAWYCKPGLANRRLQTKPGTSPLEETSGYVPLFLFYDEERQSISRLMSRLRRTNSLRASCHEYRMIAMGYPDFVLNTVLNVWDHAAGVLIVNEAGGVARLVDGTEYALSMTAGKLLVARSEECWKLMADAINSHLPQPK